MGDYHHPWAGNFVLNQASVNGVQRIWTTAQLNMTHIHVEAVSKLTWRCVVDFKFIVWLFVPGMMLRQKKDMDVSYSTPESLFCKVLGFEPPCLRIKSCWILIWLIHVSWLNSRSVQPWWGDFSISKCL